ncbi:unnamed protein product [Arctia plantaginis]|uniref:Uncharacterized protein n=1 Tax=Arctia plantaginis TaxID=874455 RepID=A0A8S0YR00_ARCPL|nr:unnamed protein product [Arctia plantaginis]
MVPRVQGRDLGPVMGLPTLRLPFTNAYCCFRDAWMLPATSCDTCAMTNPCATANPCEKYCGCNCPSPAATCQYSSNCGCGCQSSAKCDCGCMNAPVYFPEVEYPLTIIDINPCMYSSCQCF